MAEGNGKIQPVTSLSQPLRKPHNLEAERDVLGAMLLDNYCINEVLLVLRGADFYHPAHQTIYNAIIDLYTDHQAVDLTMLADELRRRSQLDEVGGIITLAQLEQGVLSTGSAPELARLVAQKATLRKLMQAAESILHDCAEENRDVDRQVDVAEKRIFEISQQTQSASFVHIRELMEDAITEIGELHANKGSIPGIPTHYADLDNYLNGLHKGDLLILAARPSVGKTAFALNIALNIAHNEKIPVGIFSLEMGKEQLNMRLLCSHAQVSSFRVRRGLVKESDFTKLREKATELQEAPIFIDDTPGLSLMQLRSRARRLAAQQQNLGLIIVDYLQLMHGDARGGRDQNRQQEVSEISRGLKDLARDLQVPVLALSQLSRNIEQRSGKDKNARPMLSDLRESGAIEQDADIVMFVHRERREAEKDEDGNTIDHSLPVETEIIIGKHRNGPIGTVELLFFSDYTRFFSKDGR